MKIDFQKNQKLLLYLFNSPLRGWLGVPKSFIGHIDKVAENSIHSIKSIKNGVMEVEMIAMVGNNMFAKHLEMAINYGIITSQLLPRILFPAPRLLMMALTTTNFNVGNGDGYVGYNSATWATVHDAATGDEANTSFNYIIVMGNRLNAGTYYIKRSFLPADTSAIGAGATITSAVLNYFSDGNTPAQTEVQCVVTTTQASTTALATSDYASIGSTNLGQTNYTGGAAGTAYSITISSPDTNISKTGFTKLGLREVNHDLANVAPTQDSYGTPASSEFATSAYRPYYAVTYSVATTGAGFFMMM